MHTNNFVILNKQQAGSYPQLFKTLCLISVLKLSIIYRLLEPKKCSQHIAKLIQSTFQYYSSINGYDFHNVSSFQIAIQISNDIWHPQYNTKQEIVKCCFTVSFLGPQVTKKHEQPLPHTHPKALPLVQS